MKRRPTVRFPLRISYTVSPDYFHALKFHQFAIPENFGDASAPRSLGGTPRGGWG